MHPCEDWQKDQDQVFICGNNLKGGSRHQVHRSVVPDGPRWAVFHAIHLLAHTGVKTMRKLIKEQFIWSTVARDVSCPPRSRPAPPGQASCSGHIEVVTGDAFDYVREAVEHQVDGEKYLVVIRVLLVSGTVNTY